MITNDDIRRTMVKSGVMMKGLLCAACLTFSPSHLLLCPAGAQMLTDIKVVAIQYKDSLKDHTKGYTGGDNLDLDFRKGRGGGYVFTLFKNSTDTAKYITDVVHLNDAKNDELWKIYLPRAKVALTEKIAEIIAAAD